MSDASTRTTSNEASTVPWCPVCNYDLDGLPAEHHCPECGFEYDGSMILLEGRTFQQQRWPIPAMVVQQVVLFTAIIFKYYVIAAMAGILYGLFALGMLLYQKRRRGDREPAYLFASPDGFCIRRSPGELDLTSWRSVRNLAYGRSYKWQLSRTKPNERIAQLILTSKASWAMNGTKESIPKSLPEPADKKMVFVVFSYSGDATTTGRQHAFVRSLWLEAHGLDPSEKYDARSNKQRQSAAESS